jgi:antitoxin PrlF
MEEIMNTEVLSVSSKGQVVLQVNIRKKLDIGTNTKLAANITGNIIMLKVIDIPTADDFSKALDKAQKWAKSVGYKKEDVNAIIKAKRRSK